MKTKTQTIKSLFNNGAINHLQLLEGCVANGFTPSTKWYLSRGVIKQVGTVVNPIESVTGTLTIPLYNI